MNSSRARPRLLLVNKSFWPHVGGMEETVRDLARIATSRWDVTVLCVSEDAAGLDGTHESYRVVRVGRMAQLLSTPLSIRFQATYQRLASQSDVIHIHSPYPPAELAAATTRTDGRLVVTYHFDVVRQKFLGPLHRPLLHAVLRRADAIVCSSPNLAATSPMLAPYHSKIVIIPPGIDAGRLGLAATESQLVSAIRARYTRPRVLFVGRLVYYKGIEYLIKAAAEVDIDLLIVGRGSLERPLRELASEMGILDRTHFLSYLSDCELKLYYHACDVFVLPSIARSEAFGLVLLEAMAAGKPLVTTELGTGTSWVNLNGQTGIVVPPASPTELAAAIKALVAKPELARRYALAAEKRVREVLSRGQFASKSLTLYESLLSHSCRERSS